MSKSENSKISSTSVKSTSDESHKESAKKLPKTEAESNKATKSSICKSASVGEPSKKSPSANEDDFKKHRLLNLSYQLVYKACEVNCSKPKPESESKLYAGHDFTLNNMKVKFRVGKSTPTKIGHFVTLWKRIGKNPIQPYDVEDPVDLVVVCVQDGKNVGQFVFSKSVLAAQDILSRSKKGGKRATRVYAPWIKTESSQATDSKIWQTKYFLNLSDPNKIDLERAKKLYGLN